MTPALSFSYLLAHPESLGFSVRQPAVLLVLLLLPAFMVLARRDFDRRRLALAARLAAFALLVLTLAGLAVSVRLPNDRMSVIAVVDQSQSIDNEGRRWQARYLDQVVDALAPGDEFGVVAFAGGVKILAPPGPPKKVVLGDGAELSAATDIGRALDTAMALLPPDAERRVLLLSDGNETRGGGLAKVARARRSAVSIYAAVPPHAGGADLAVEKLAVPPLVAEGNVFPVHVVLRNRGRSRSASLSLWVDGAPVGEESIRLQPGLNAMEIPYRMRGAGSHRLRAQVLAAEDAIAGNNYREAALTVGGKGRALLVTPRPHSHLARVLARKDVAVTTVPAARFPARLEDLLEYHCVVFEDVAANAFAAGRFEVLERYVRDFGGGFVVAAGGVSYGDVAFKKTAVERLLPVTLEPRRPPRAERAPLALFLLIDRSNSMGYHVRNRLHRSEVASKLVYARRAAAAVVDQLKDNDMVGVIAFDSQPFEVAALRRVQDNRRALQRDIPRLQPGGGTDFYDALESARRQLVESRVVTKHVILLTDGDTNRGAADHYPLIAGLAKADITVTTIRIGDDTVNLTLLHDISSRTGGQFHHVENAEILPELLLKDTSQALAQAPRGDEIFPPRIAGVSQVLRGISQGDLPDLHGYAYARLRRGADLLLYVLARDKKDPLMAAWQYGLGRVVAFTASLSDDAEAWIGWEGLGKLWSQVVHWAAREQTPWDYALDVRRAAGQTTLTVQAFGDLDDAVLMARLSPDAERAVDVALVPHAPRLLSARLPDLPGGRYPLTITRRSANRQVTQRTEVVLVPDADEEPQEEFQAEGPNRRLLEALAAGTGGAVDAPLRTVIARKPGNRRAEHRLDWLLIPLAMLLFLADVGLRRLSMRTPARS